MSICQWVLSDAGFEQVFSVSFMAVNAAVHHRLSLMANGANLLPEVGEGSVVFDLTFGFLFVSKRSDTCTLVRWQPNRGREMQAITAYLFQACAQAVLEAMRYTYPDLTLEEFLGVMPTTPATIEALPAAQREAS